MGAGASREAGRQDPLLARSFCQTQPRPHPPAPPSFAERGSSTTGNKTAHGRRKRDVRFPSCNLGLVLEEKHVSLVSGSPKPLGAQRWIFFS